MPDFIQTMLINTGVGAILVAIKNPERAKELRITLLHVADAIYGAFGLPTPPHD